MAKGSEPTPSLEQAVNRVHEALEGLVEALGPRRCPHGEWHECPETDCNWDNTEPISSNLVLTEWVIASIWTDLETGNSFINLKTPMRQLRTHTIGLLRGALDVM